ncbi:hypothetical protein MSPP1_002732 [Malassezia sp. CBS 17886]|nr:hypothetical protein MSPP1_002732 [Malassezia sp. CBS 17886]
MRRTHVHVFCHPARVQLRTHKTGSAKLFVDARMHEDEEKAALLAQRSRPQPGDAVWAGEERVQDTVLRMLVDKYKPMRAGDAGRHAESRRLSNVQQPPEPARRLRALRPPVPEPVSQSRKTLRRLGLRPEQLPHEDPKAMGRVRTALRRVEKQSRLEASRDAVRAYGDRKKGTVTETPDEQPQMAVAHAGRGFAGVAEAKIQEALRHGVFTKNTLRGRPLPTDHHAQNPNLSREEYLMYRMVQRQGGAPPLVEFARQVRQEEDRLRAQIQQAWIGRALQRLSEGEWRLLSPVPSGDPRSMSPDAQRTVEWARGFRDGRWVTQEGKFHEAAIGALNQLIRRYNHAAPPSARRSLYNKHAFLQQALRDAHAPLVDAVSERLRDLREGRVRGMSALSAIFEMPGKVPVLHSSTPTLWQRAKRWLRERRTRADTLESG